MASLALVAFVCVGCGPSKIALKPTFWQTPNKKIGIAVVTPPAARVHRAGGEGLIDAAINAGLAADLQKYFRDLQVENFSDVAQQIAEKFQSKGMTAKVIGETIDLTSLPKTKKSGGHISKYDVSELAAKEDVDAIFLIKIEKIGSYRIYYGFIPLQRPEGYCLVKGELISGTNNEILWTETQEQKKSTVAVEGQWDEAPNYPNLTQSIIKAVGNSKQFIVDSFFQG